MKHIFTIKSVVSIIALFLLTDTVAFAVNRNKKTAEEYDKVIKSLYKTNKIDSMKIILEEALKRYPNDTDLNRWAGTYFLQKQENDNARYFLIKAVQLDSTNFLAKQQLVTLEEETGNLSSAICYVNEMLELYPYDQFLWKKKIGLYRKQGYDQEADRLLQRLYSIYPNDTTVQNDYLNRIEETYIYQRKIGNRDDAIQKLRLLMKFRKREKTYYLDLSNLLLQEGHTEEAVASLSKGLEYFPLDKDLLQKKAEIMAERGNNKEAIELLKKSNSTTLSSLADNLLYEAARNESWKDPYVLYGKIYETKKSDEALDYLLRTALSREYNEDALFYLAEYKKRKGNSPDLLYKEYRIYKRIGDWNSAIRTLEKYMKQGGPDTDMANELAILKTERADEKIKHQQYAEAILDLEQALAVSTEEELESVILNKLIYSYINSNKNDMAVHVIDSVRKAKSNKALYTNQKAEALHKTGETSLALVEIEQNGDVNSELYEQLSAFQVKQLLENGALKEAYHVSKNWIQHTPNSKSGLQYVIRTSEELKNYNETDAYLAVGREKYPDDPFFVLKTAAAMYRNQEYTSGLALLSPWVDAYPGNKELVAAYSSHAEMVAEEYIRNKKPHEALSLVKQALSSDTTNQALFYTLGSAYELAGYYDSAYIAYSRFKPEALWIREHKRKLMSVKRKGYKNSIVSSVLSGWQEGGNNPNILISTAYLRKIKKDLLTATVNINCRNSTENELNEPNSSSMTDNMGAQIRIDWEHTFNSRWSTTLGLAAANDIFPSWLGQAGCFYMFPNDLEVGLLFGYRKNYRPGFILTNHIQPGNMYHLRLSGGIYKDLWRIQANGEGFLLNNKMYFNLNTQFRYYPLYDGNSHILFSASAGTAPEIDFVDKLMPGSFENINLSLGIGGVYMVSKNISLGIMGTYHYFYNQTGNNDMEKSTGIITKYKNLYDIYAQLIFCF